jgi:hypothetical protein
LIQSLSRQRATLWTPWRCAWQIDNPACKLGGDEIIFGLFAHLMVALAPHYPARDRPRSVLAHIAGADHELWNMGNYFL